MAGEPEAPVEIPWRLAATTQQLKEEGMPPDDATVSLFYYEPSTETLERDYPNHRLIYLKATVSVAPFVVDPPTIAAWGFSGWLEQLLLRYYLRGGVPVWHMLLDLVVTPRPFVSGGIEPYFHAARPTSRQMIETGVVGNDLFEGTAEGVSFGKSATQINETVSSRTRNKSKGFGFGTGKLPGPSFSVGSSSTTVDSERHVDQTVESTTRDAAKERRELLSHMTNVENVLSLLNAYHIGSPYLRFSLWPRPLRLLSVDATDPNLWYQELIYRRSRGIEGVQEFVAVLVVPRGTDFCVNATLSRFGIIESPPARPRLPRLGPTAGPNSLHDRATMLDKLDTSMYLHKKYPVGYPLDLLDVDVIAQIETLKQEKQYPRPAVNWWAVAVPDGGFTWDEAPSAFAEIGFTSPALSDGGWPTSNYIGQVYYKDFNEVQYEREEEEYQALLEASPLERGKVISRTDTLDTCFRWDQATHLAVAGDSAVRGSVGTVAFTPASIATGNVPQRHSRGSARHRGVALRWNQLQEDFSRQLTGADLPGPQPLRPDDPTVVAMVLDTVANLDRNDPLNVRLPAVVSMLQLSAEQHRMLSEAGVTDLRDVARFIRVAEDAHAQQNAVRRFVNRLDERDRCRLDLRTDQLTWSVNDAVTVRDSFRRAVARPDWQPPHDERGGNPSAGERRHHPA